MNSKTSFAIIRLVVLSLSAMGLAWPSVAGAVPQYCPDECTPQTSCASPCYDPEQGRTINCSFYGICNWGDPTLCRNKCSPSIDCTTDCTDLSLTDPQYSCGGWGRCGFTMGPGNTCTAFTVEGLKTCLDQMGGTAGTVLVGSSINVGSERDIVVPSNVTLTSDPPRAYWVYTDIEDSRPIFHISGSNVTIRSLAIGGKNRNASCGDTPSNDGSKRLTGIAITGGPGITIEDNNISGFRGSGVSVSNCSGVTIMGNDFSKNRASDGSGYGVVVGNHCHPEIVHNTFSCDRHGVAGTGGPGCGYTLMANTFNANIRDQQVDMHGCFENGSCEGGPEIAGEYIVIKGNTFKDGGYDLYDKPAIWIRGIPSRGAEIEDNSFDGIGDCTCEHKVRKYLFGGPWLCYDGGAVWQTHGSGDWENWKPERYGRICMSNNTCGNHACDCLWDGYAACSPPPPYEINPCIGCHYYTP